MEKKSILPLALFFAGASFLIISLLLFFFKSNKKLLARKFKLGGIILTLSGSISSCQPVVTCYEPIPPSDEIYLNYQHYNSDSGYFEFDRTKDSLLAGNVENVHSGTYSYRIITQNEILLQGDNIQAADSAFDTYSEEFQIPVSDSISEGKYHILFYDKNYSEASKSPETAKNQYSLRIKN
jgi:hypothetical protein